MEKIKQIKSKLDKISGEFKKEESVIKVGKENKKYFITPMNEGQELNYIETHEGSYISAETRAKDMVKALQSILFQGMISAMIESGNKTFYIN